MERLRKTSVYLWQEEAAALRRVAETSRRSQSELLRQAIRILARAAFEGRLEDDPPIPFGFWGSPPSAFELPSEPLTHEEDLVLAYFRAGCLPHEIAGQLRLPQARVVETLIEARRKLGPAGWGAGQE